MWERGSRGKEATNARPGKSVIHGQEIRTAENKRERKTNIPGRNSVTSAKYKVKIRLSFNLHLHINKRQVSHLQVTYGFKCDI